MLTLPKKAIIAKKKTKKTLSISSLSITGSIIQSQILKYSHAKWQSLDPFQISRVKKESVIQLSYSFKDMNFFEIQTMLKLMETILWI